MTANSSVEFFDRQFKQQVTHHELALNPFESAALPYLAGTVLDFGCGLGNLALAAARLGSEVFALDASRTAIEHVAAAARLAHLPVRAEQADLRDYALDASYDSVVSIGLLMFFDCATAYRQLARLQSAVKPGGVAAINVLSDGTTFMDMFSPEGHCLFQANELLERFDGWEILYQEQHTFAAPRGTTKQFTTVIARRPCATAQAVPST